jgi:hypothetical protein
VTLTNSGAHSAVSSKSAHIRDRGPELLWRWAYEVQERGGVVVRKEARAKRTLSISGHWAGLGFELGIDG